MEKKELVYEALVVGEKLGEEELVVTQEDLDRYLESIQSENPWYRESSPWVRPIVPTTIFAEEALRILDRNFTRFGTLHTNLSWQFYNPAFVGEKVYINVWVSDKTIWNGREWFERYMEVTGSDGRRILLSKHGSILHLTEVK
jgi:hypothetical protein